MAILLSVFVLLPFFPVSADNDVDGKALFCQHKDYRPRTKDIGIVFKNGKSRVIFLETIFIAFLDELRGRFFPKNENWVGPDLTDLLVCAAPVTTY